MINFTGFFIFGGQTLKPKNMKKLLFIFVALFLSLNVLSQSQVVLRDSTVINIAVKSFLGRTLVFYTVVPELNASSIDIGEVIGLNGETPNYRKTAIIKKNPNIVFNPELIKTDPNTYQVKNIKSYKRQTYSLSDPGKSLISAGTLYLTGTALTLGGTMVMVLSKDDDLMKVGVLISLGGFICDIIGHTKLVKAGSSMVNKPIALGLSDEGLGIAIKF